MISGAFWRLGNSVGARLSKCRGFFYRVHILQEGDMDSSRPKFPEHSNASSTVCGALTI
jgi:hypothetical protein